MAGWPRTERNESVGELRSGQSIATMTSGKCALRHSDVALATLAYGPNVPLICRLLASRLRVIMLSCTIAIAFPGCAIHTSSSRVSAANQSVIAFLVHYSACQAAAYDTLLRYDPQAMTRQTDVCLQLQDRYRAAAKYDYKCRFEVRSKTYSVTCSPSPRSGLKISFYLDQSPAIRLAEGAAAGPGSRELDLNESERVLMRKPPRWQR